MTPWLKLSRAALVVAACLGVLLLLLPRVLARSGPLVGWRAPSAANTAGLFVTSACIAVAVVWALGHLLMTRRGGSTLHLLWMLPLAAVAGAISFLFLLLGVVFIPYFAI
jgi:hypothetical protein